MMTMDWTPLPGGYGHGSSSLGIWIKVRGTLSHSLTFFHNPYPGIPPHPLQTKMAEDKQANTVQVIHPRTSVPITNIHAHCCVCLYRSLSHSLSAPSLS